MKRSLLLVRASVSSLLIGFTWIAAAQVNLAVAAQVSPDNFRIPVLLDGETTSAELPLFVGVPFPKDWQIGPIRIVDEAGNSVPSSARIMARWPESEAIRWVGIDFLGSSDRKYFVVPGGGETGSSLGIQVEPRKDGWRIATGSAYFDLGKQGALIEQAWLDQNADGRLEDSELVLKSIRGDELYVVDQNGLEGWAGLDAEAEAWHYETAEEERAEGQPLLRAVFRREGWYQSPSGERLARHVTRLHFYAGVALVKIEHRLVITEKTETRWFREYGVRVRYASLPKKVSVPESADRNAEQLSIPWKSGDREVYLFQEKAFYMSRMDPKTDCHFEIGRIDSAGQKTVLKSGALAGNWFLTSGSKAAVGVALRNLWQTYPKEIATTEDALTVKLWSSRAGAELDFRSESVINRWPKEWFNEEYVGQDLMNRIRRIDTDATGFSRSHEMFLSLYPASDSASATLAGLAGQVQNTVVCLIDPKWLRFTEAMGHFHPYDAERFPEAEAFMEQWFDQYTGIWKQWGDYGFFEFGHWPHVWYRQATKGPLAGRWYPYVDRYGAMMDYGFYSNVWRSFARSGKRKYFDAAEEVTRQRLDMGMVHWDGIALDEPIQFNRWQGLPRRLRGTYVVSNSPIIWGGGSSFHHNSGTDIRALSWLYYLTDHRDARDMIDQYSESVKRVWNTGNLAPFRGSRPFASLRNLATVYQETGDPQLRKIIEEQVNWLADLEAPQGVSMEKETTRLGKYGVKAGAMERVHEVLGHELAGKSLLRGAETRALTSLGEDPFSYVNVEGEQLSAAWRMTGNPVFPRAMRRDMEIAVSEYKNPETGEWLPMWGGVGPSSANNVYPSAGMAYAMDAIADYENRHGVSVPLTPFLRQASFGPETLAVVYKSGGKAVALDLRSNKTLAPEVFNAAGEKMVNAAKTPWVDQFYSRTPAATRWEIVLPAEWPEGSYLIDSGGRGAMWEVTWTDAPGAVLYVPKGFALGPGGRQWGNRIMAGDRDHNPPAFFWVSENTREFRLAANRPCQVIAPSGKVIEVAGEPTSFQTIAVSEGDSGKLWKMVSPSINFIRLEGVPPLIAYGDAARFFDPADAAKGISTWTSEREKPKTTMSGEEPVVKTTEVRGAPSGGVLLIGRRQLEIPSQGLINLDEGVIELWVCPQWDSATSFLGKQQRTILDGGSWKIFSHRYGEMALTATVQPAKESKETSALETNAGLAWEKGAWCHVALQWRKEGKAFLWELFVDGKKQTFGIGDAGMPGNSEDFIPAVPSAQLVFGGKNLDAILGAVRISRRARYDQDFSPLESETLRKDSDTSALYLFVEGITAPARLTNP